MSRLEEFKNIADHEMFDIKADEALKRKVLRQCSVKRNVPVIKYLVPIACSILVVVMMKTSGMNLFQAPKGQESTPEMNTLIDSSLKSMQAITVEEARESFGKDLKVPEAIPENFNLMNIEISKDEKAASPTVTLFYGNGEKAFQIRQTKTQEDLTPKNGKAFKIQDVTGALIKNESGIEVHWFKNGVQTILSGQLTQQEARYVAESMK